MYSLMLLNGGIGSRVAAGRPKQFIDVAGRPIIVYSLVAADAVPEIDQIVLNYPEGFLQTIQDLVADYAIQTPVTYVPAGASRHESVAAMLPECRNDRVLIHESARPLVGAADFKQLVSDPRENVSLMLPIPFTVAPVDPENARVTGSLERDRLRNVQLPQKFSKADLAAAHDKAREEHLVFTEDATLVAVTGHEVHYIDGQDTNIKVTTPTDVKLAGFLLAGDDDDA
ncbi:IspD/TarI family cytidylyltransferase [Glycomyces buryatensis]|uniref:2-C-methyl-D-erythritol 4-phosphate cytidylyltransferase n=1 Tax=Glycomyces buryatensis TaxID=2570927 RepID=A0A4V4HSY1_9ACTN|nr:IspD/TarI family cytidylyltransferase [Glycomyces buryatensis]THV43386.1 2-C-methyl-D-erythritol 4-phosphate cytidylyltransferase [Glycomyces buryatensis]